MIPVGLAGAACAYFLNRRRGSNDVAGAGGAADAAFGGLPAPDPGRWLRSRRDRRAGDRQGTGPDGDHRVVPPRGLDPWQGRALLRESVDDQTVLAWFSDMVACEALVITGSGDDMNLALGSKHDLVPLVDQAHLARSSPRRS